MCDAEWYLGFLDLNPRERRRRDLVVAHAEAQGGVTSEYFRRLFPRYWFDSEAVPPGMAGSSLGLTIPQENKLLVDMSKVVLPAFRSSAEYSLPHGPNDLRFPEPSSGRASGTGGGV